MKEFYSDLIVVHEHLQTLYDGAKKDVIEIGEIKERLDRIESVLNKHLFSDEIIITGKSPIDQPENVEFIDIYNCPTEHPIFKNVRKTITPDLARKHPYVKWNDEIYTLYDVGEYSCLISKKQDGRITDPHNPYTKYVEIATVSDLIKAGITE